LALLTLGFGTRPTVAPAATINPNASTTTATYRLTSTTSLPVPDASVQGPQVVAAILPPGSVVPPTLADGSQGSPLTVLPDSTGFDPNQLVVALKDTTNSSGQPEQMFGLVFFGQGLKPGGVLHFALSVNSALASNPPVLESLTPGVSIVPDPIATGTDGGSGSGGTTPPVGNEIPEPVSMVLWSSVAIGIAARRRLRSTTGREP
jgi:hypothetical protein